MNKQFYTDQIGTMLDNIKSNTMKNLTGPFFAKPELQQCTYFKVHRATAQVFSALYNAQQPLTIKQIASTVSMSNSNLTPILNVLEKDEIITRKISPKNRKYILVSLTEKGYSEMEDYHRIADNLWCEMLSNIYTEEQLKDMVETMIKYNYYINLADKNNILFSHPDEQKFESNSGDNT